MILRLLSIATACLALACLPGCDDGDDNGGGGGGGDAAAPALTGCLRVCAEKLVECREATDTEAGAAVCEQFFCESPRSDAEIECYRTAACPERRMCDGVGS